MSEYTLVRIWGYYMNLNRFLDDFPNYTVEQDYQNVDYVPGKGYAMTMLVCIKETTYLRIDKTARRHKIAYTGMDNTGGCCAPSNTGMRSTKESALAVLESLEKAA